MDGGVRSFNIKAGLDAVAAFICVEVCRAWPMRDGVEEYSCEYERSRKLFMLNIHWGTICLFRSKTTSGISASPDSRSPTPSSSGRLGGIERSTASFEWPCKGSPLVFRSTDGYEIGACAVGVVERSAVGGVAEPFDTRRYVTSITPRYRGIKANSGGASCSTAS